MKKVLSLFMVLLLAISLFACGKEESKEPTVPAPATPGQVTPVTPPETPVLPPETVVADILRYPNEIAAAQIKQEYQQGSVWLSTMTSWPGLSIPQEEVDSLYTYLAGTKDGEKFSSIAFESVDELTDIEEPEAYIYDYPLYFDLYFRSDENKVDDYIKVSLKADYKYRIYNRKYHCRYDVLYPYLEANMSYEAVIVVRIGNEIVMWNTDTFIWREAEE